jgi:hypothetical protein
VVLERADWLDAVGPTLDYARRMHLALGAGDDSLFPYLGPDGRTTGYDHYSYDRFISRLHWCLRGAGVADADVYSGHSFRRGGRTAVEYLFPGNTALADFVGRWRGGGSRAGRGYNGNSALVTLERLLGEGHSAPAGAAPAGAATAPTSAAAAASLGSSPASAGGTAAVRVAGRSGSSHGSDGDPRHRSSNNSGSNADRGGGGSSSSSHVGGWPASAATAPAPPRHAESARETMLRLLGSTTASGARTSGGESASSPYDR